MSEAPLASLTPRRQRPTREQIAMDRAVAKLLALRIGTACGSFALCEAFGDGDNLSQLRSIAGLMSRALAQGEDPDDAEIGRLFRDAVMPHLRAVVKLRRLDEIELELMEGDQ